jgi:hypothetical protein
MGSSAEILSGVAEGEMSPSTQDLQAISGSCLKNALNTLTPDQKSALRSKSTAVRQQVTNASDLISARQSKIKDQITVLQNRLNQVDSGSADVADFFRLFQPAIISCPDGQAAATQIKVMTDRALAAADELRYQISLAKILQGLLLTQSSAAQDTLATLDRINLLLG